MKRIKSILLIAMLSLFGFSSCADKEDKIDDKDLVINVETLKSFIGKTLPQVKESLSGHGYEYLGFEEEEEAHIFEKGNYSFFFAIEDDVVTASGYQGETNKATAFVDYVSYSAKCYSFAGIGTYEYGSWAYLHSDDYEEFDNYQDYMIYFNQNMEDIEETAQYWEANEDFFGIFLEDEGSKHTYMMVYIDETMHSYKKFSKSTLFSRR